MGIMNIYKYFVEAQLSIKDVKNNRFHIKILESERNVNLSGKRRINIKFAKMLKFAITKLLQKICGLNIEKNVRL